MAQVRIEDVCSGMVLSEPIYNDSGTIELLRIDTVLTERHIEMLKNLDIYDIAITDESNPVGAKEPFEEKSIEYHTKVASEASKKNGIAFDVEEFRKDLHEIEIIKSSIYNLGVPNSVNKQMVVNVLTGEGDIPIDVKHEKALNNTKDMFKQLQTSDTLDLTFIRENVEEMLPDMIRNDDVLMRLGQLKEMDNDTFDHSLRVSILSTMMGKWMSFSDEKLLELNQAALLANIGNMKVPSFILQKEGKLDPDEYEIVKKHCQFGYAVLLKTQGITDSIKYSALQHHERIDGSGYPLRLKSGQIHEFSKIIMVCDIFNAMTSDRPYRKKLSPFEAAEYILWQSGVTLDTKVCYVFLSNISKYFVGKKVILNDGKIGTIVYVDPNHPTKPTIQVDNKFIDLSQEKSVTISEMVSDVISNK